MGKLRRLLSDLHHRHVWQVLLVYLGVSYAVLEAVDLFTARFSLPPWLFGGTTLVLLAGLPIVLTTAYFQEERSPFRPREPGEGSVGGASDGAPGWLTWGRALAVGVVAFALLGAASGGWWLMARIGSATPEIRRVAVLPPANLGDSTQEFFVLGMHDAIISEMARAGIAVIARTSVMAYRDAVKPVREIARELGVQAVVEGSVYRSGDSVRIQAQLIDGATEEHLWAGTFEGHVGEAIRLHRRVTRDIAREIRQTLSAAARERLATGETVDPRAYEAYLRARLLMSQSNAGSMQAAVEYLERALALAPDFAPLYVTIAGSWAGRGAFGLVPLSIAIDSGRAAIATALALDSTLAEAHGVRASFMAWSEWRWDEAEVGLRRTIEADPGLLVFRTHLARLYLLRWRHEEAERELRSLVALDPLRPGRWANLSILLNLTGRHHEALDAADRVFALAPGHNVAMNARWTALDGLGRHGEALVAIRAELVNRRLRGAVAALDAMPTGADYHATLHAVAAAIERFVATEPARPFIIARFYDRAGDPENALRWLEQAFEERDTDLPFLAVAQFSPATRRDPRFQDIVRRMGLLDAYRARERFFGS